MLIMARSPGQTTMLGDDVEVTVAAIFRDRVRLEVNYVDPIRRVPQDGSFVAEPRRGERVHIDRGVSCQLVDVRPDCAVCRLGFVAPRETAVHRREVYDALKAHYRKTT